MSKSEVGSREGGCKYECGWTSRQARAGAGRCGERGNSNTQQAVSP